MRVSICVGKQGDRSGRTDAHKGLTLLYAPCMLCTLFALYSRVSPLWASVVHTCVLLKLYWDHPHIFPFSHNVGETLAVSLPIDLFPRMKVYTNV